MTRHVIPHSRPTVGREDERAAVRVLRSGMLGGGTEVEGFEREIERFVGAGRAVAVHTGSAALHLALLGLGIQPGDRVVLPTYTCAAVLNAVHYTGAEPILADVSPETCNLDPDDVKRRLRAGTKAIIAPHLLGRPAPIRELRALGVPVVEDCAMALGASVGREGEVAVYSFYATKMMATGHGGAVLARDRAIVRRIEDLVQYDGREDYRVRHNYRMSALVAALGRSQLAKVPDFVKRRRRIADYYYGTLELGEPPRGHVFYRFVLRTGPVERFVRFMASRGIECKRPVFRPLHRYLASSTGEYPGAEELHRHWTSIPLYPSLRRDEMERVALAARQHLH
ncbi:MAG: aminotransferase class I/II-fold pyridoxal phosphate-dependent enzyme [Planctomycetaceae bacterium]|nr:aminotransferase class I/II-fold pyridoxal phosphate-dependent enzyme [Planctomycetaceae bacterium]